MRAGLDLAEAGIQAYLLETSPALGGRVARLGFHVPHPDCVLCRGTSDPRGSGSPHPTISPGFLDENRHPNLTVINLTRLLGCEGEAGDFSVQLEAAPRYGQASQCTSCGRCAEVCPETRPSGFQLGMSVRKVIDKSAPALGPGCLLPDREGGRVRRMPPLRRHLPDERHQLAGYAAILHLSVGAIILAMGFQPFDAGFDARTGLRPLPQVITSMQYERLASRSGPTEGVVRRRSDGAVPKRIAWLQCVGFMRPAQPVLLVHLLHVRPTKEAVLAKQRIPGVECHIFTMDDGVQQGVQPLLPASPPGLRRPLHAGAHLGRQ